MPYRLIHTDIYDDLWFQGLSERARHLWYFLNITPQVKIAGVWQYSRFTISNHTRIPPDEIPNLLAELSAPPVDGSVQKVRLYPVDYLWITNHMKHQLQSRMPKVLRGVVKETHQWKSQKLRQDFITHYKDLLQPFIGLSRAGIGLGGQGVLSVSELQEKE